MADSGCPAMRTCEGRTEVVAGGASTSVGSIDTDFSLIVEIDRNYQRQTPGCLNFLQ